MLQKMIVIGSCRISPNNGKFIRTFNRRSGRQSCSSDLSKSAHTCPVIRAPLFSRCTTSRWLDPSSSYEERTFGYPNPLPPPWINLQPRKGAGDCLCPRALRGLPATFLRAHHCLGRNERNWCQFSANSPRDSIRYVILCLRWKVSSIQPNRERYTPFAAAFTAPFFLSSSFVENYISHSSFIFDNCRG